MRKGSSLYKEFDWLLIGMYFLFLLMGWMSIYAVTSHSSSGEILDFSTKYGKQIIWIFINIPIIFVILTLEAKFYTRYSSIIYILGVLLLLGVLFLGKQINGARSWYAIGSFTIQPSEFAKATTALAIAKLLSDRVFDLKRIKNQRQVFILLAVPIFLILLQSDPGSAVVFMSFLLILYREGLPSYYIFLSVLAVLLFLTTLAFGEVAVIIALTVIIALLLLYFYNYQKRKKRFKLYWRQFVLLYLGSVAFVFCVTFVFNHVLKEHHRNRFNSILGKKVEASAEYNKTQALISIASGGFSGKGFLQGDRTQGDFIPEQETDYIFTSIGEEFGFIGTSIVTILFVLFILRIIFIAERQKSKFSRVYGYGVAVLFFTHFAINIGMVIGVMPTIGVPLPFFSYGGSSLIGFTILLFIFVKLDAYRTNELN